MQSVGIIDIKIGNTQSLKNALNYLNCDVTLTNDIYKLKQSDKLIFPGVGHFSFGSKQLYKNKLRDFLINEIEKGKKILAICLGMQLLFQTSEEDLNFSGLSVIKGKVRKLPEIKTSKSESFPNTSWKNIEMLKNDRLLTHCDDKDMFYFIHSYYCEPTDNSNVIGYSKYNNFKFASVVKYNNCYGTQFHPEKSGKSGLNLLSSFLSI
tara:strand:+ start:2146 stop:2769 length:624 start_codon:yes stop_codon:yes gene_type:complete